MKLKVRSVRSEDFLQDLIRVHSSNRKGLRAGQLCKVTAHGKHIIGEETEFQFNEVTWLEELNWVWRASDPVSRTAGRLGIVSLWLGAIGLLLGVWSIVSGLLGH